MKNLATRRGLVPLPAVVPVTTFGPAYPLDRIIRPYLPRLAHAMLVSYHYAREIPDGYRPPLPLFVDSGGFAALRPESRIVERDGLGCIEIAREDGVEVVSPAVVLDLQARLADVAFSLDFPIPPGMPEAEARQRQALTHRNALWALERRPAGVLLFASVQAWDVASARAAARAYRGLGFDGLAIGGLVPRAGDRRLVAALIRAVRAECGDLPLHVFGLGAPELVRLALRAGADSTDSSAYVRAAADSRSWAWAGARCEEPGPLERATLALGNLAYVTYTTLPAKCRRVLQSRTASARGWVDWPYPCDCASRGTAKGEDAGGRGSE